MRAGPSFGAVKVGVGTGQNVAEVRGVNHTGFGGTVGDRGIMRELLQLASVNASFASRFLVTLLAASYHPSGSSKSGVPLLPLCSVWPVQGLCRI